MGLSIENGGSDGAYQAKVTNDGMLKTLATTITAKHYTNHVHATAYNLIFSQTASSVNDCILYIKNGSILDMIVHDLTVDVPTDETIEVKLNDLGTPIGGSIIIPSNLNAGSNNVAEGVYQAGNDITGLSGGVSIEKIKFKGGESTKSYNFDHDIVIPKNRILTLYCVNGSILVNGMLSFFFHRKS